MVVWQLNVIKFATQITPVCKEHNGKAIQPWVHCARLAKGYVILFSDCSVLISKDADTSLRGDIVCLCLYVCDSVDDLGQGLHVFDSPGPSRSYLFLC